MPASNDTIVAIATAPGRGGVGIVRLSGLRAAEVATALFQPKDPHNEKWPSHHLLYGKIVDPKNKSTIDDGLAVLMPSPHSYTGEDVVEFQTHGSPIILEKIVSLCKSHGARLAEPGEFTKRAFLNGKLDLIQAEAVAELINSESEAEAQAAMQRLDGNLSTGLEKLRSATIEVLAELEADVDFPDENLPVAQRPTLLHKIKEIQIVGNKIRDTYDANQRLQSGFSVAFIGRPNVGKSSLFNALLQMERAIVTATPGTTRDVLREELMLDGRRIRLVDTAGLRATTQDEIEKIGMERTAFETSKADLVCMICSAAEGFTAADQAMFEKLPKKNLWLIWNKVDLQKPSDSPKNTKTFLLSAVRGDGIAELRSALGAAAVEATMVSGGISNDRQRDLIDEYLHAIRRGLSELEKNTSPEFIAFEFRQAHRALSRILGKDEGMEEILSEIFSRFCVGK